MLFPSYAASRAHTFGHTVTTLTLKLCISGCVQGKYEVLPAKTVTLDLTTSSTGSFSITKPATAAYTFKSSYPGSTCVDSLTSESLAGQSWRLHEILT